MPGDTEIFPCGDLSEIRLQMAEARDAAGLGATWRSRRSVFARRGVFSLR
jgi:hypothetical protein